MDRVTKRDAKSTKADTKMRKAILYTDMPVCVYMYVKSTCSKRHGNVAKHAINTIRYVQKKSRSVLF